MDQGRPSRESMVSRRMSSVAATSPGSRINPRMKWRLVFSAAVAGRRGHRATAHGGEQRVIGCPGEFGEKFANQVRTGEIGWYEVPEYGWGSSRRPSDERAVVRLPCWPGLT